MITSGEAAKVIAEHTYGSWRPQKGWKTPLFIARAEGVYLYGEKGDAYLDFSSQLMCSNLGHGNRAILDAITEQAKKLPYIQPGFICEIKARATKALLQVMPEGLDQFFFSTSGTEANEAAVSTRSPGTRSYHGTIRITAPRQPVFH